jgi:hypothetical protein
MAFASVLPLLLLLPLLLPLLLLLQDEESEYTTDDSDEDDEPGGRPKLVKPVFVRKQEREVRPSSLQEAVCKHVAIACTSSSNG